MMFEDYRQPSNFNENVAVDNLKILLVFFRFYLARHSGRQLTLQPQMVRHQPLSHSLALFNIYSE